MGLKGHRRAPPCLFLPTLLPPTLLPPGTHFRGLVTAIERPQYEKQVTLGAAWEGVDTFLQDHYLILHVAVNEVYPDFAAAC